MGAADKPRGDAPADCGGSERSIRTRERAVANAIPALRRRAGDFAATHGAEPELVEKIELAVSEAVTNAVKYAYADGEGTVELNARAGHRWVEIQVVDHGGGFLPGESDGLGIGLSLVAQMSGDLEIAQTPQGTTVTMRFPLAAEDPSLS